MFIDPREPVQVERGLGRAVLVRSRRARVFPAASAGSSIQIQKR
jgi:hypothetical protein